MKLLIVLGFLFSALYSGAKEKNYNKFKCYAQPNCAGGVVGSGKWGERTTNLGRAINQYCLSVGAKSRRLKASRCFNL